jgi:acyl-CoA reductase-like NAD-dependent aldehyde dehydrogenase
LLVAAAAVAACCMLLQVFLEDAGYDWKVLGPDVQDVDYVAWQADQDAYACSGQKCSAQSLMLMHSNWRKVSRSALVQQQFSALPAWRCCIFN